MYLFTTSFFILLTIFVIVISTLPQYHEIDKPQAQQIHIVYTTIKTCCVTWFTIEILIRLFAFPSLFVFFSSPLNIIESLSLLAVYLNILFPNQTILTKILNVTRVSRVLSFLRIFKHTTSMRTLSDTLKQSRHEIYLYLVYLFIGVLIFSSAGYLTESTQEGTLFTSIPAAAWVIIINYIQLK